MTLKEIAELAGVSPSAVSRYLNGGSLSAVKYEAIRKVIEETGYVPNQMAHNLRTGHVHQVGVLVPKIHSQSVAQVLEGIHEVLSAAGYMVVVGSLEHQPDTVQRYLDWMQSYSMAGAIVMASSDAEVRDGTYQNCSIPLVITGQNFKDFNCVYHDDYGAAKDLTSLLLQRGRTRIACISGPESDPAIGIHRVQGVKAAMTDAGLNPKQLVLKTSDFQVSGGKAAMEEILLEHPDVDGVFCATDSMAQGALLALKAAGKRVPEDVSLVAFGNHWANTVSEPNLTTAELYQTQCGKDAANILLEALERGGPEEGFCRQTMLSYKIVERGSV